MDCKKLQKDGEKITDSQSASHFLKQLNEDFSKCPNYNILVGYEEMALSMIDKEEWLKMEEKQC